MTITKIVTMTMTMTLAMNMLMMTIEDIDNDDKHLDDDNYHNVGCSSIGGDLSDKGDGDTNDRRNPSAMTIVIKSNFETPNIAIQFGKV